MLNIFITFFSLLLAVQCRHIGELVCRQCGQSITRQSEIINMTGVDESQLKYSYDFNVVGKAAQIRVLQNPSNHQFHVVGAKTAHLKFSGTAQSDSTWFHDMQWTICVCKTCDKHMGWYFQPQKTTADSEHRTSFVGLVLENLISADYADSLIKTVS